MPHHNACADEASASAGVRGATGLDRGNFASDRHSAQFKLGTAGSPANSDHRGARQSERRPDCETGRETRGPGIRGSNTRGSNLDHRARRFAPSSDSIFISASTTSTRRTGDYTTGAVGTCAE